MTLRELIEDALIEALEHFSPPAEFTVTLPLEDWLRIRDPSAAVFNVCEHRMTIQPEGMPLDWETH